MSKQTRDASQCWGPYVGAVSLAFDDGRESQLTHAIPMMNDCGVRGTFYVSGPLNHDDWQERIALWVQVARDGHEINGPRLSVTTYHFRMLLDYLKRRSETIWTAPVVEVAQKVAKFQARRCGRTDNTTSAMTKMQKEKP